LADAALALGPERPALSPELPRLLADRWGEPIALVDWRRRAYEVYQTVAAPDRVQHLWHFTDPAALLPAAETLAPAVLAGSPGAVATAGPTAGGEPIVLLAPGAEPHLSDAARAAGFELLPLASEVALSRLGEAVPADHGLFEALSATAWTAGLCVRLPAGREAGRPLRIVVPAGSGARLPRLLVIAERDAAGTIVEEHAGGAAGGRVVGVTELLLAPGARLRHVLVQRWEQGIAGHLTVRGRLERDASLLTAIAAFGGSVAKSDLGSILVGEGARAELAGVVLGEGTQQFDHHTRYEHRAGSTWSNLDFKVALNGRARSAYTGLIRIQEGAPGSQAYQENRNLMLSPDCRADTIPELEILTDEVSCTHGATVAPVDPEHLFYLRSRGISPRDALRLVVRGFLEGTLRRLPDGLREELETLVSRRLAQLAGGA
jgi:Fe-S cluster assembly protein SufD